MRKSFLWTSVMFAEQRQQARLEHNAREIYQQVRNDVEWLSTWASPKMPTSL